MFFVIIMVLELFSSILENSQPCDNAESFAQFLKYVFAFRIGSCLKDKVALMAKLSSFPVLDQPPPAQTLLVLTAFEVLQKPWNQFSVQFFYI